LYKATKANLIYQCTLVLVCECGLVFRLHIWFMMWSTELSSYFSQLKCPDIPLQYGCMNPYLQAETMEVVNAFLHKYYQDSGERTLLFGINPGRFGSGITGISFTDPIRLKEVLQISHDFQMRPELSSEFIYEAIEAYGGPEVFFRSFFISAVYPLGFLHNGKNINYYELNGWKEFIIEPIVAEMEKMLELPVNRERCICIGKGENYKFLTRLNEQYGWFERVEVLPHPRWILQYRRKQKEHFLEEYVRVLGS